LDALRKRIAELDLTAHVDLLGQLDEQHVAQEMRAAHAMVHASDYETYSAVCAEALCCGTPVIASGVGGIPELVGPGEGQLVATNTAEEWTATWAAAWKELLIADRGSISRTMIQRAGIESV